MMTVLLAVLLFLQFEAVTIRPNPSGGRNVQRPGEVLTLPGGVMTAEWALLGSLIQEAYALKPFQVTGGADWMNSARYDLAAKAAPNTSPQQVRLMLQSLLKEKFKLVTHRETKPVEIYSLTAAPSGAKLQPPKDGACFAGGSIPPPPPPAGQESRPNIPVCGRIELSFMSLSDAYIAAGKVRMDDLTRLLTTILGRPVIDRTGFTGAFDVDLKFTPDAALAGLPGIGGPSPGGQIFTAIQEQLGLKLEPVEESFEVLVIDNVEKL